MIPFHETPQKRPWSRRNPLILAAVILATGCAGPTDDRPAAEEKPLAEPIAGELPPSSPRPWFSRHQSDDGHWSSNGFSAKCDPALGAPCANPGDPALDVGVTGLVLVAFMACGYDSTRPSPHRESIREALKYLRLVQNDDGSFVPRDTPWSAYSHACATLAMCVAYESTRQKAWNECAQSALDALETTGDPKWAGADEATPTPDDILAATWASLAMTHGRWAGLTVRKSAVVKCIGFLERAGESGVEGAIPAAIYARYALQLDSTPKYPATTEVWIKRQVSGAPVASEPANLQHLYFATLAVFASDHDAWDRWSESIRQFASDHESKAGCSSGSWTGEDAWTEQGGRVGSTALMYLLLTAAHRHRIIWR